MKTLHVEALRIRQPEFQDFPWWVTSPTDALDDEGRRQRERKSALLTDPSTSAAIRSFMSWFG